MSDSHWLQNLLEPRSEYTPVPFWFWNGLVTPEGIRSRIGDFHEKGVDGFVIHPRKGLDPSIPYLSARYFALVREAVRTAAGFGMKVCLYDEGMYPSGSAHGRVVAENPAFASRGLSCREITAEELPLILERTGASGSLPGSGSIPVAVISARKTGSNALDPSSLTVLYSAENAVQDNRIILALEETPSHGTIRGLYPGEDDGEPDAPASADLLNPDAVQSFIRHTHQRYFEELEGYFGTTVFAMFTDEPEILGRNSDPGLMPWTSGFLSYYLAFGNRAEDIAALWYELGENTQALRDNYRRAVNNRMSDAYYRPISDWCEAHRIALTGHPAKSGDIALLRYFHIPGQDLVWRWVAPDGESALIGEHSTMAKCSSDAARHALRRRNTNECFGCCGPAVSQWAFSGGDMKWYFDWLFVRGVNMIMPHAFYYAAGPDAAGYDRPPDAGPNNIWWPHYHTISDYIKRMGWLLTDSINQARVAMLCGKAYLPWHSAAALFRNQIEFNYLEDDLIGSGAAVPDGDELRIASQRYRAVVIDRDVTVSASCGMVLSRFASSGGRVFQSGQKAASPDALASKSDIPGSIHFDTPEKLVSLLGEIEGAGVSFLPPNPELRISVLKKGETFFYLLVNEGESCCSGSMEITEPGTIVVIDPWKGTLREPRFEAEKRLQVRLNRRESLIVAIDNNDLPGKVFPSQNLNSSDDREPAEIITLKGEWTIRGPDGFRREMASDSLSSWLEWKGLERHCGSLDYTLHWRYDGSTEKRRFILDLGGVSEMVEVRLNGSPTDFALWAPYRFDISAEIESGENLLEIRVTNSIAVGIDSAHLPSGLLGPVCVEIYESD